MFDPSVLPVANPKRLRLQVSARAELCLKQNHPWVYDRSFTGEPVGGLGDLGVIFDRRGKFLAIGLWDPTSVIRWRRLQGCHPALIDRAWFAERCNQAARLRDSLPTLGTTGYRLIHGENDGLPGLVLDRYNEVLVLKLYTAAWLPHLALLLPLIAEIFMPVSLVLRLSRNIQAAFAAYDLVDGQVLFGEVTPTVLFQENGLTFEAEVLQGQKTGFFLDQRDNRQRLGQRVSHNRVLNVFSFSGGFSVYAAQGGCAEVTSLDISQHALASAVRNFEHNPQLNHIPHHILQGDAFALLKQLSQQGQQFDTVILDPPSFAPRERDKPQALQAYLRLLQLSRHLLAPGGLLVSASCSAHVRREEFLALITQTLPQFTMVDYTAHGLDHPVTFPEADYLKCWFGKQG